MPYRDDTFGDYFDPGSQLDARGQFIASPPAAIAPSRPAPPQAAPAAVPSRQPFRDPTAFETIFPWGARNYQTKRDTHFQNQAADTQQQELEIRKKQAQREGVSKFFDHMTAANKLPPAPRKLAYKQLFRAAEAQGFPIDDEFQKSILSAQEEEAGVMLQLYKQIAVKLELDPEATSTVSGRPDLWVPFVEQVVKARELKLKETAAERKQKLHDSLINENKSPQDTPSLPPGPSAGLQSPAPSSGQSGGSQGPSLADRNNNPGNIKIGPLTNKWVQQGLATVAGPATDGGHFLKFTSAEAGFQAVDDLLSQPFYADKTVEEAMRKWSGGGYGADVAQGGIKPDTKVKDLSPQQRITLVQGMAKREGFAGPQRPHTESTATAPPQVVTELQKYDRAIAQLRSQYDRLTPLATDEEGRGILGVIKNKIELLQKDRDAIEKRYNKDVGQELEAESQKGPDGKPWLDRTGPEKQVIADRVDAKKRKLQLDTSATQGENAELVKGLTPEERKTLYTIDKETGEPKPVPATWNRGRLQKETEAGTQFVHLEPLSTGEADKYKALAAAKDAAIELQPLVESPVVIKEIGNIVSNPEGFLNRMAQKAGKDMHPDVYKVRSQLSRLAANLQRAYAGLAQSGAELKTLQPFIVHLEDATPQEVKTKLNTLIEGIHREYETHRNFDTGRGVFVPPQKKLTTPQKSSNPLVEFLKE